MNIKLPIIDLYPRQRKIYDSIISHSKHYAVIMAHRRWGKDLTALSILSSYAIQNVGIYYYFAPFLRQIKEIIIEGLLQDGKGSRMIDIIPDEVVKFTVSGSKVNMSNLSVELVNGSRIFFRGADDNQAQVGVGATGVVFTEMDMINTIFYKKFRPIIATNIQNTGKGFMLFISTPRSKTGNMARLFTQYMPRKDDTEELKQIKSKWYLDFIDCYTSVDHDGNRRLPDSMLEEEKYEMGEEEFMMEYELSFTGSGNNIWYGKQLTRAYKEKRIRNFGRETPDGLYIGHQFRGSPVYVSWDIGITDKTSLWFYQINPATGSPRFILHHMEEGKTLDYYIEYIKEQARLYKWSYVLNILPHDSNNKMMINVQPQIGDYDRFNIATKRVDYLQSKGLRCFVLDRKTLGEIKWRIINRINTVRKELEAIEIDEKECFLGIEMLRLYRKTYNKQTGEYTDVPFHGTDGSSDCADSFAIGVMYYTMFLKNNKIDKNGRRMIAGGNIGYT